jgi:hypothetical protein
LTKEHWQKLAVAFHDWPFKPDVFEDEFFSDDHFHEDPKYVSPLRRISAEAKAMLDEIEGAEEIVNEIPEGSKP